MNYYNEFDAKAAQWLRNLIEAGMIPAGDVDERSIAEVKANDLKKYTQCHFFAGIGGWSLALELAGWPATEPVWTGSCPCQPFSAAGKGKAQADERHLWPVWFNLIRECLPATIFGEQVAAAIGKGWLDGVHSDMESEGYAIGSAVLPACAVNAPHRRDRLWFVADTSPADGEFASYPRSGREGFTDNGGGSGFSMANAECEQFTQQGNSIEDKSGAGASSGVDASDSGHSKISKRMVAMGNPSGPRSPAGLSAQAPGREGHTEIADHGSSGRTGPWGKCEWILGADGKARRVEPSIPLLAHGVPARVAKLRAIGNAIVPQVAAEVISAYMECRA